MKIMHASFIHMCMYYRFGSTTVQNFYFAYYWTAILLFSSYLAMVFPKNIVSETETLSCQSWKSLKCSLNWEILEYSVNMYFSFILMFKKCLELI